MNHQQEIDKALKERVEHTPGPWKVRKATPQAMRLCELGENGWEPVAREEGQFLCVLADSNKWQGWEMPPYGAICAMPVNTPTGQANARLIAGAPELLEALKTWERWYSVDSSEYNRETARGMGLAAILKAEKGA